MKYDNLGPYIEDIDKPDSRAITDELGDTYYYNNNISLGYRQLHRENGPAVELSCGYKAWYRYGKKHREGGPAVVFADGKEEHWYYNDKLHRTDGPAVIEKHISGIPAVKWEEHEYWINGVQLTKEEFLERQSNEKA